MGGFDRVRSDNSDFEIDDNDLRRSSPTTGLLLANY